MRVVPLRPPKCPLKARQRRPNRPCDSVFVCGSSCRFLPTMFWLKRVFVVLALSRAQPSPHGFPSWDLELGFPQSVSQTAVKLTSWCMKLLTITSATSGYLFFTLGMQSAQLAQWAASTPAARHSPSPPKFEGTRAALRALSESPSIPTNWQKRPQRVVVGLRGGRTGWKLVRGAAQNKRSNHALWRSRTAGTLCNRIACSVIVASNWTLGCFGCLGVLGVQGVWGFRCLGFYVSRVLGFQGFRVSGFQVFCVLGFLCFGVFVFLGFWGKGFRCSVVWGLR